MKCKRDRSPGKVSGKIECEKDDDVICLSNGQISVLPDELAARCNGQTECDVNVNEDFKCDCISKDDICPSSVTTPTSVSTSRSRTTKRNSAKPTATTTSATWTTTTQLTDTYRPNTFSSSGMSQRKSTSFKRTTHPPTKITTNIAFSFSTSYTSSTLQSLEAEKGNGSKTEPIIGTGTILGVIFGLLALITLTILLIFLVRRRKQKQTLLQKSGSKPHYFTVVELPNNHYDEIVDTEKKGQTEDYNHLGDHVLVISDKSVLYSHTLDPTIQQNGYTCLSGVKGDKSGILNSNYSHVSEVPVDKSGGDYNQLMTDKSKAFFSPNYNHISVNPHENKNDDK